MFSLLARLSKKLFAVVTLSCCLWSASLYADDGQEQLVAQPTLTFDEINQTLESVLHTINEIGYFIIDFVALIKEDPLDGLLKLAKFLGELLGIIDGGDGVDGDFPIPGPGLANIAYEEKDLFQPVGWVNQDNGLPGIYPGRKPFGTNLGMMIDGYFFTLFAPDSGQGPGGFLFYDVSNPFEPKLIRRIYEADTRTTALKEPHAFGLARINGRRYMVFQSTIGVEFWDFTDLNNLQRVGEIDLPGVSGGDYSNVAWQLAWQAPYVYVAGSEQGVYIIDASDPANPVLADRGGKPNPIPPSSLGGFRVGPIFTFGHQLVISSMENRDGLASLDISDPLNPTLLDRIPDLDQFYYASCFNGEQVAISVRGSAARMMLFDLQNPSELILQDDQLAVPGQLYCAFQDHYVFQGAEERVHKIDIRDPQNPVEVGSGTIAGPLVRLVDHGQVSPMGNLVFIGNDHGTGSAFVPHDLNPDTRAPQVLQTSPRHGAEQVGTTTAIGVAFSDVLDFDSVNTDTIQIVDDTGLAVPGIYSLQNGIVNFSPSEPLKSFSRYEIRVASGGVKDVVGNAIEQVCVASFSTGAGNRYLDVDLEISAETIGANHPNDISQFDVEIEPLPGATYRWDFGDGNQSELLASPLINYQYAKPGHYQVSLTIEWQGLIRQETFIKTIVPPLTEFPAVQSSTLAHSADTVFVVNPDNGTVTAIDKSSRAVLWETAVGDEPQTITWVNDQLWVAVRGDDALAVLSTSGDIIDTHHLPYGSGPFAVVYHSRADRIFVSMAGSNRLVEMNLAGDVLASLGLQDPRAIAVSGAGDELFVSRLISPDSGAEIYRLNRSAGLELHERIALLPDTSTVDSQDQARGVANYLFDLAISPSGNDVTVVAKKDNIFRGQFRDGQNLAHDKTVRAVTHQIAIDPVNPNTSDVIEWDFDNRSNPRALVYSPLGDYLFVALQGSNKVAVMDVFSGSQRVEIETPLAPQGLLIDESAGHLYVHNFMARSVAIYDVAGLLNSTQFSVVQLATISTVANEALDETVLLGKQVFYNADDPRMSRESYFSCASCHVDGGHDGRTWDFTERGEGLRNTITLEGRAGLGHGNVHWTANFDEIQDFENDIRGGFGGTGFLSDQDFEFTKDPLGNPKAGMSAELDALADYVGSLVNVAKSPAKSADGSLATAAQAGKTLFQQLDCQSCHAGPQFTDGERHVLPTINSSSGAGMGQPLDQLGIETPTLSGLWNTAPYFHHGGAATLDDTLRQQGHGNAQNLTDQEMVELTSYLLSLDGRAEVVPQQQVGFKLRNERWGCLDVDGSDLVVNACEGPVARWLIDEESRIQLVGNGNQCVEHNGKVLRWSRVAVAECSDSIRQQFIVLDNGQLQVSSAKLFALDAFGDQAGSQVGIWWRHRGANQRWTLD